MGEFMLVLSGTFKAVEGAQATLIAMAKDLLPLSRSEAGCIRYDFFQDPIDPQRFLFFELWRTREDLRAHFEKPYFKIFAERLPALTVEDAEIVTYETSGATPAFQK